MSVSVEEFCDVYKETRYTARKEHVCCACDLPIRKGDTYTRVFILYDGNMETFKRCARCQLIHEHLRELGRKVGMWPMEALDCGNEYEDEWGPQPEWLAALAFWRQGDPLPHTNPCWASRDVDHWNCINGRYWSKPHHQCWRMGPAKCQLFALPLGPYSFSNPCSGEPTL